MRRQRRPSPKSLGTTALGVRGTPEMSTDLDWIRTEVNFLPDQNWIGLQFF